ncbi:MAG: YjjG family noncanonical pyrimidine nucleotidase [Clostridia bacterium]|nr:YjjG family noncanonical pyrimidine nucleotidase [Clostridia bacterium]
MSRYPIILLDADNTLFDFSRSEEHSLRAALAHFSLPYDDGLMQRYREANRLWWQRFERGETAKAALRVGRWADTLAGLPALPDLEALNVFYMQRLSECSFLIPGAEALCRKLRDKHRLFVVTNGSAAIQRSRIAASPLAELIDGLFISDELGWQKPQPELFEKIFAAIGGPPRSQVIIFGDSLTSDVQGGINAGIDACWYNPCGETPDRPCTYIVKSFDEFYDIVR